MDSCIHKTLVDEESYAHSHGPLSQEDKFMAHFFAECCVRFQRGFFSGTQRPGLLVAPSDDSGAKNQADAKIQAS